MEPYPISPEKARWVKGVQTPDIYPTSLDRELWAKAVQTPDQVTEAERLIVFRQPDLTTQVANSLKVSGLTPEELKDKALTNPESMTSKECNLLIHRFNIWSPGEGLANSSIHWDYEDVMANIKARRALATPRDDAVTKAASVRSDAFAAVRRKETEASMKKWAEDLYKPSKWIQKLIGASALSGDQPGRWGFVVFQDGATTDDSSSDSWDKFVKFVDRCADSGLNDFYGSGNIAIAKEFIIADELVSENNPETLRSIFQQRLADEVDPNPRILRNTFLLVTPEVIDACLNTSNPWIWAYDANFDPLATLPEHYEGRLKVSLFTLFTWFYAVRSEGLYNMGLFWEKAQTQDGIWSVSTQLNRYHSPLIILEKGASYLQATYELENDP